MQILSLAWGIFALLGLFVGFIPCLGALNWLNIPFSIAGLILSIIAYNKELPGRRSAAATGIILCAIAILLGAKRLVMGGGIL
ncbi:MAG: hypothetical protein JSU00_19075 [Acidobacteria bacterium]|nr:hypothetical protein [Acidobacteriota bacterium]